MNVDPEINLSGTDATTRRARYLPLIMFSVLLWMTAPAMSRGEPFGACCLPDGSCTLVIETSCNGAGGFYQGDGSRCDPNPCPQIGACCAPDGSCTLVDGLKNCESNGGVFNGAGTSCADGSASCLQPECPGQGSCFSFSPDVGCDDADCCNLICTLDPFCCDELWDTVCVGEAERFCLSQPCPWDCTPDNGDGTFGNGEVNVDDVVKVILEFGSSNMECDSAPDNGDGTFGNGVINVDDLVDTIVNFGACP
ncbi:MAG: hypothetical protein AAF432_13150 [Planctomycetota bacterium]